VKAAIAIDKWKLEIFTRHLTQDGYSFVSGPGVTHDTLMINVEVHERAVPGALGEMVRRASEECEASRRA
jgi:hypothetical protein